MNNLTQLNIDKIANLIQEHETKLEEIRSSENYIDCLLLRETEYAELKDQIRESPFLSLKNVGISLYVGSGAHYDSLKNNLISTEKRIGIIDQQA